MKDCPQHGGSVEQHSTAIETSWLLLTTTPSDRHLHVHNGMMAPIGAVPIRCCRLDAAPTASES